MDIKVQSTKEQTETEGTVKDVIGVIASNSPSMERGLELKDVQSIREQLARENRGTVARALEVVEKNWSKVAGNDNRLQVSDFNSVINTDLTVSKAISGISSSSTPPSPSTSTAHPATSSSTSSDQIGKDLDELRTFGRFLKEEERRVYAAAAELKVPGAEFARAEYKVNTPNGTYDYMSEIGGGFTFKTPQGVRVDVTRSEVTAYNSKFQRLPTSEIEGLIKQFNQDANHPATVVKDTGERVRG